MLNVVRPWSNSSIRTGVVFNRDFTREPSGTDRVVHRYWVEFLEGGPGPGGREDAKLRADILKDAYIAQSALLLV